MTAIVRAYPGSSAEAFSAARRLDFRMAVLLGSCFVPAWELEVSGQEPLSSRFSQPFSGSSLALLPEEELACLVCASY